MAQHKALLILMLIRMQGDLTYAILNCCCLLPPCQHTYYLLANLHITLFCLQDYQLREDLRTKLVGRDGKMHEVDAVIVGHKKGIVASHKLFAKGAKYVGLGGRVFN